MKVLKLNLVILFIFGFTHACFTQNSKNGKVVYKAILAKFDDKKGKSLSYLNDLIEDNDSLHFELLFNKNESVFKIINSLNKDDSDLEFSKILLGGRYVYYNSKNEKPIYQIQAYGEFFLVNYDIPKWTLINEKKKIGNYLCYKASTTKVVRNSRGTFNNEVTAWYTNEVPISYGPRGYFGLPGLILELQEKNKIYVAKSINLNLSDVDINKPKKGKNLTQQEFENIGIKMDEERFSKSK